ncbi:unannotated protein [freshwater metagenome]|uniref:Unannotated protein n=1 Tax=freshwater metagenome TaxID=449393 RepID=A0A6J5ZS81_9ZZZZ
MCSKEICRTCGKATWSGCGEHIEEALHGIPQEQRCSCDVDAQSTNTDGGFFSRLLGGSK